MAGTADARRWPDKLFDLLVRPAHAQTESPSCPDHLRNLIGLRPNGTTEAVTLTLAEGSTFGVCEVLDVGNYLLASVEGMYDNGQLCPLVTLHRASGEVSCLRSALPARYQLSTLSSDLQNSVSVSPDRRFVWLHTQVVEWETVGDNLIANLNHALIRLDFSSSVPIVNKVFTTTTDQSYAGVIGEFLALPDGDLIVNRRTGPAETSAITEWWVTSGTGTSFQYTAVRVGGDGVRGRNPFYDFSVRSDGQVLARAPFVNGTFVQAGMPYAISRPQAMDSGATVVLLGTDFSLPPHGSIQNSAGNTCCQYQETKRIGDMAFWTKTFMTAYQQATLQLVATRLTDGVDLPRTLATYDLTPSMEFPIFSTLDYAVYAPQSYEDAGPSLNGIPLPQTNVMAAKIDASGAIEEPFELIATSEGFIIKHITTSNVSNHALVTALNIAGDTLYKISCRPASTVLPRCRVVYTAPYTADELARPDFPLN